MKTVMNKGFSTAGKRLLSGGKVLRAFALFCISLVIVSSTGSAQTPADWRAHPAIFNASHYLALNSDLLRAGIRTEEAATAHWLLYGLPEGRRSHLNFDVQSYLARYSDLRRVFGGTNYVSAAYHFTRYGIIEGRNGKIQPPAIRLSSPSILSVYNPVTRQVRTIATGGTSATIRQGEQVSLIAFIDNPRRVKTSADAGFLWVFPGVYKTGNLADLGGAVNIRGQSNDAQITYVARFVPEQFKVKGLIYILMPIVEENGGGLIRVSTGIQVE